MQIYLYDGKLARGSKKLEGGWYFSRRKIIRALISINTGCDHLFTSRAGGNQDNFTQGFTMRLCGPMCAGRLRRMQRR
jgi:hypothetical protein